jgi:hypothetical protein
MIQGVALRLIGLGLIGLFLLAPGRTVGNATDLALAAKQAWNEQRYAEAGALWQAGLARFPTYRAEFAFNLGNASFRQQEWEAARQAYGEALKVASNDQIRADAYYNLGLIEHLAGKFPAAREMYRKSLQLRPSEHDAKINLELAWQQKIPPQAKPAPAPQPPPPASSPKTPPDQAPPPESPSGQDQAQQPADGQGENKDSAGGDGTREQNAPGKSPGSGQGQPPGRGQPQSEQKPGQHPGENGPPQKSTDSAGKTADPSGQSNDTSASSGPPRKAAQAGGQAGGAANQKLAPAGDRSPNGHPQGDDQREEAGENAAKNGAPARPEAPDSGARRSQPGEQRPRPKADAKMRFDAAPAGNIRGPGTGQRGPNELSEAEIEMLLRSLDSAERQPLPYPFSPAEIETEKKVMDKDW